MKLKSSHKTFFLFIIDSDLNINLKDFTNIISLTIHILFYTLFHIIVLIILLMCYMKSQCARADSSALRVENERVQKENLIYRDELKKIFCTDCGVPLFPQEKHEHFMQQMSLENSQLKDKASELIELTLIFKFDINKEIFYTIISFLIS